MDFGLCRQPSLQILLETFLGLKIFRDNDDGPVWKKFLQQRGKKRLRRPGHSWKNQRSALLHAPGKVLHGGN